LLRLVCTTDFSFFYSPHWTPPLPLLAGIGVDVATAGVFDMNPLIALPAIPPSAPVTAFTHELFS